MLTVVQTWGQQLAGKSQQELRVMLQESKPDSNRLLMLHALGNTYLVQEHSDKLVYVMDTAIDIFDHAIRLSDTLQLKNFKYECMLLQSEACLVKSDTSKGKKRFFEVIAIYHAMGEWQKEADTWLRLAWKLNRYAGNLAEINSYFEKSIELYKQVHNIKGEADARIFHAHYFYYSNKFDLAQKEAILALNLFSQIKSTKVIMSYLLLSMINRYGGSYEKALLYATKGMESAEHNKNADFVDAMYGELALVYEELGRTEESAQWYWKTLYKRIELKSSHLAIFRTAGLLIRQLIKLKKSKEAINLMDSLVALRPAQTPFEKAIVAQNYAYCFDALKQFSEAEQYFLAMAAYYKKAPFNPELLSIANMDIGRFYLKRGQFKKAHNYLDTASTYRLDDRLLDQKELFYMLFAADSALGNYMAAIDNLQQYKMINDSIFNEKKSRQIEELTIQYETQKKEQSIRLLENEKRLQQNKLRWIVGATLLLVVIIGLLVYNSRLKQRTNKKLQVQQKQIEKKNDSLQQLVAEKEWLVREIHHRVKNNFHMVMGLLRTQAAYLQSEEAIQAVTESSQRIQAMSLVHQKLYQSVNLSAINMADYIHELVDHLKDSFETGHAIRFNLQIAPIIFNVSYSIPLGLIVNEAVTNAIKHAFPGKKDGMINISLKEMAENHFQLAIKDNGVGLPAAFYLANQTSMGMKLMRGLSDDLDATFRINNNKGTEITLDFITEA